MLLSGRQCRVLLLQLCAAVLLPSSAQGQTIPGLTVCPNALYTNVPFLNNPIEATYFVNIQNWGMDQVQTYIKERLLPRVAASLAFLALALLSLIIFLLWRLIRCCGNCCCRKAEDEESFYPEPASLIQGPYIMVLKVLAVVSVLGVVALCAVGMGTASKLSPTEVFISINRMIDYTKVLSGRMTGILNSARDLYPISYSMVQATNGLTPTQAAAVTNAATSLNTSVGQVVNTYTPNINSFNSSIDSASGSIKDADDMTNEYNDIAVKVFQAIYAASLVMALLLALFVLIHCPFGIAFFIALCYIMVLLLFLIAFFLAVGLSAGNDVCPNLEPIVSIVAPSKYLPVLSYYLNYTEPSSSLETVLSQSELVNVQDIRTQALGSSASAQSTLQAMSGSVPAANAAQFQTISHNIDTTTASINASIGASTGVNASGLLAAAAYGQVNPLYVRLKVASCCDLMDQALSQWATLTAAGWLLMLTCTFATWVLGRLDQLPQGGTCCACKMLTPGKVQAAADESAAVKAAQHASQSPMQAPAQAPPMYYPTPQPQQYYVPQAVGTMPPGAGMARDLNGHAGDQAGAEAEVHQQRAASPPIELPPRRTTPDLSIPPITVPAVSVPSLAGPDPTMTTGRPPSQGYAHGGQQQQARPELPSAQLTRPATDSMF